MVTPRGGEQVTTAEKPVAWWRWAGAAAVLLFLGLVLRFWQPVFGFTDLFQLDASNDALKLEAFRDFPVFVYRDTGGYDGLYYAQLSLDPSLRDPELPRAMDNFAYRARRILPSAIAWLVGLGQARWIIVAYSLLNIAAWLTLAWLLWRILEVRDGKGWLAWAGVMFSAGALHSVRLSLTDLPALVLVTAAIGAAERMQKRTALVCIAAAGLARETSLLGIAGLVKRPWLSVKNAVRFALAVLPLLAWIGYVRWRAGPADQGWGNLDWPLTGFVKKWHDSIAALFRMSDFILGATTLLALIGLTVQAIYLLVRRQPENRWWRMGAAYVALLCLLGTAVWEGFPGAATRVLLPLTIAFNVLARSSRGSIVWLMAGNLGVFAGLAALRGVPSDPSEIADISSGRSACIVDEGSGWYDREQTSAHHWIWTSHVGTLSVESWPPSRSSLRFIFALRSLHPCVVRLCENGREIWETDVGLKRQQYAVPFTVTGGRAEFEFSTDAPPQRESAAPNARQLAFALYDLRLAVPKP